MRKMFTALKLYYNLKLFTLSCVFPISFISMSLSGPSNFCIRCNISQETTQTAMFSAYVLVNKHTAMCVLCTLYDPELLLPEMVADFAWKIYIWDIYIAIAVRPRPMIMKWAPILVSNLRFESFLYFIYWSYPRSSGRIYTRMLFKFGTKISFWNSLDNKFVGQKESIHFYSPWGWLEGAYTRG